jgi:hypothetical protein
LTSAEFGTIGQQKAIRVGALPGWLLFGLVVYAVHLRKGQ